MSEIHNPKSRPEHHPEPNGLAGDMVERVAYALYEAWESKLRDCVPFDKLHAADRDMTMCHARAAIKAMRVPTPAIAEAGAEFIYEGWGDGRAIAAEAWRAMIDAALGK